MKQDNSKQDHPFANIFEQAAQITKAHGFDILAKQVGELKQENAELKIKLKGAEERIKALKEFINDVRPKEATVIEMGGTENDIPREMYLSPSLAKTLDENEPGSIL
jgi:hypothetical protein